MLPILPIHNNNNKATKKKVRPRAFLSIAVANKRTKILSSNVKDSTSESGHKEVAESRCGDVAIENDDHHSLLEENDVMASISKAQSEVIDKALDINAPSMTPTITIASNKSRILVNSSSKGTTINLPKVKNKSILLPSTCRALPPELKAVNWNKWTMSDEENDNHVSKNQLNSEINFYRPESLLDNNDSNDNDEALLLAAEAAASLFDDMPSTPTNSVSRSLPTRLLDAVEMNVDTAESAMIDRRDNLNDEFYGPLGPSSQVKTFRSILPTDVTISASHSAFLSHYFANDSAYQNNHIGGNHVSFELNKNEMSDEEYVENGDVDRIEEKSLNGDALRDISSHARNSSEHKESRKEEASELSALKFFCSNYPKPKNRNHKTKRKEGVTFEDDSNIPTDDTSNLPEDRIGGPAAIVETSHYECQEKSTLGPKVEVINGEIVITQSSLLPNPISRTPTALIDAEFGSAVVEDETHSQLGAVQAKYDSYLTTPRRKFIRWGVEETKAFYRALRQCGTDFSMMQIFFPNRTRDHLKNKFKLESRKNPRLIDMALDPKCTVKFDISIFGEGLEIPSEVSQIISVPLNQQTLVTPSETPPLSTRPSKLEEVVQDQSSKTNIMNQRNFDHVFENIEVEKRHQNDSVENISESHEENTTLVTTDMNNALMNGMGYATKHMDKSNISSQSLQSVGTDILPLAPIFGTQSKSKKSRFKATAISAKKTTSVKK